MSRIKSKVEGHPHTTIISGADNILGFFKDVVDERFAGSKIDPQGEGYLFESSRLFGISTNKIGAKIEDTGNDKLLCQLVDKFIDSKFTKVIVGKGYEGSIFDEDLNQYCILELKEEQKIITPDELQEIIDRNKSMDQLTQPIRKN